MAKSNLQPRGHDVSCPHAYENFHVFTLEWYEDRLDFFLDGVKGWTFANNGNWPFDKPQFIILNLAIGGTWGGKHGIDNSIFPVKYLVDYVRVYEKE
jgi:beta-glucanase (GH16 family)